jgi:acetyl-CoA acetyltransferase
MSLIPMGGNKVSPNPSLVADYPDVYLSTGLVAENHAREASISREEQDAFALESHQRAVAAIDAGRFSDEIVPMPVPGGQALTVDEGPRRDTSLEALAALRPAFHAKGTVTAGNSSQTSDGAAAVIVMDEALAKELGLRRSRGSRLRDGRRRARAVRHRPGAGRAQAAGAAERPARETWTSSRSTKRSPRRCSPACASCRSTAPG